MNKFVLIEVGDLLDDFYQNVTGMGNADFDIGQIVSGYVEYRKEGTRSLVHYSRYGSSEQDREDGEILFTACDLLYTEFNKLLITVDGVVLKAILSENNLDMMVEIQ